MRRALLVLTTALAMVLSMAAVALAGEVNGNGDTPMVVDVVEGHTILHAKSACAFSGLNDDPHEPGLFNDGRVQSFGDIVQEAIDVLGDGRGASSLTPIIHADGPGAACRGNASGGGDH